MLDVRRERCELIEESIAAIDRYMTSISTAEDFIQSGDGLLRLDGVTLRLQVIGENVKQIELLYPSFFQTELSYDVYEIIRFRDFISHHYEKLDYQIIYETCTNYLPGFAKIIHNYLHGRAS